LSAKSLEILKTFLLRPRPRRYCLSSMRVESRRLHHWPLRQTRVVGRLEFHLPNLLRAEASGVFRDNLPCPRRRWKFAQFCMFRKYPNLRIS